MKIYKPGDYKAAGIAQDEIGPAVRMVESLIKLGATIYRDTPSGPKLFDTVIGLDPGQGPDGHHPDDRYKRAFMAIYAARQPLGAVVKFSLEVTAVMPDLIAHTFAFYGDCTFVGTDHDGGFYSMLDKSSVSIDYANFRYADIERIEIKGETGRGGFYEIKSIHFVIDPTRRGDCERHKARVDEYKIYQATEIDLDEFDLDRSRFD